MLDRIRSRRDELDLEPMRKSALYPELIGRMAPQGGAAMAWMQCECGMLVVTTSEHHGKGTVCANCRANQDRAPLLSHSLPRMRFRKDRVPLMLLLVLIMIGAIVIGGSMARGSARQPDHTTVQMN